MYANATLAGPLLGDRRRLVKAPLLMKRDFFFFGGGGVFLVPSLTKTEKTRLNRNLIPCSDGQSRKRLLVLYAAVAFPLFSPCLPLTPAGVAGEARSLLLVRSVRRQLRGADGGYLPEGDGRLVRFVSPPLITSNPKVLLNSLGGR